MIRPDVGGAFGPAHHLYPEQAVVGWAAKYARPPGALDRRPHRTLPLRSARPGHRHDRAASRSTEGAHSLAHAVHLLGNVGAHPVSYVPLNNGYRIMTTAYHVPTAHVRIRRRLYQRPPVATFRARGLGLGCTTASSACSDLAAARLRIDRLEIRLRNVVRREQLSLSHCDGPQPTTRATSCGNLEHAARLGD